MNLAADETSTDIKSKDLLRAEFPEVKDIRSNIDEYQTLLSNNKAKKLLGWKPEHCWRDYVKVDPDFRSKTAVIFSFVTLAIKHLSSERISPAALFNDTVLSSFSTHITALKIFFGLLFAQ